MKIKCIGCNTIIEIAIPRCKPCKAQKCRERALARYHEVVKPKRPPRFCGHEFCRAEVRLHRKLCDEHAALHRTFGWRYRFGKQKGKKLVDK